MWRQTLQPREAILIVDMAMQLPMDAPRKRPIYLQDMPEEDRRHLVGALLKRFLLEQEARKVMTDQKAKIIKQLMARQAGHKAASIKEAIAFPGGKMAPAQMGALIGGGLGGLTGLIGAKSTEDKDEGYLSKLVKRLGMGAAGVVGGSMLGSAIPGAHVAYRDGGMKGLKSMAGPLWDAAKTVPMETAKKIPEWAHGLLNSMKGPAAAPTVPKAASDDYTQRLTDEMNQLLGKSASMKYEDGKWTMTAKTAEEPPTEGLDAQPEEPKFPLREQAMKKWNPRGVLHDVSDESGPKEITPEEYTDMRSGGMHPLSATLGAVLGGGAGGAVSKHLLKGKGMIPSALAGMAGGGLLGNYLQKLRMKGKAEGELGEFNEQFPEYMRNELAKLPPEHVEQSLAADPENAMNDDVMLGVTPEMLKRFGIPKVPA